MLYILRKRESGKQRVWSPCEMTGSKQSCVIYPQIRNEAAAEEHNHSVVQWDGIMGSQPVRAGHSKLCISQRLVCRWDDLRLLFLIF